MKQTYIDSINALARSGEPFLFVISYTGDEAIILPLDAVSPSTLLYDFNGMRNCVAASSPAVPPFQWEAEMPSLASYRRSFTHVRENIYAGNSYLANLTCAVPLRTNLGLDDIFHASKATYRLLVRGRFVCFSPEIFVRIADGKILSFPMKGTADASLPDAEALLMADAKEAAEHATIVDLIRNDLSRVATEVTVDRYRYVDRIATHKGVILQTSSQISGRLPDDYLCHLGDILDQLLPAGSITGAPKDKTVAIIGEAETYQRGFYTGVMGICAEGKLDSAVMIRFVERLPSGRLVFKAGGGITAQSECEKEYQEVKQKIYVPIR